MRVELINILEDALRMEDFIKFIKTCRLESFSKGDQLPLHIDGKAILYAIQSGYVKVCSIDALGNQQFLWLKGRIDIVPSERLFSIEPSDDFFYTALSDVRAYVVDKRALIEYARTDQEVMSEIARSMSEHYDDLLLRLHATEQSTIRNKLIHSLHHIAIRVSADNIVKFHEYDFHLTQEDISQLVGSTRESVAVEMKKLKDEKLIDYSRSRLTVNTDRLAQLL